MTLLHKCKNKLIHYTDQNEDMLTIYGSGL